jgi:kumamolisin
MPERIPVNGGSTEVAGENSSEVVLDLEVIRGLAPKAQILSYEVPQDSFQAFTTGMAQAIDRIVEDGRVDIVSVSWGICDAKRLIDGTSWLSPEDRALTNNALEGAAAAGITVFVASGDNGAYSCQRYIRSEHRAVPVWPGDLPNIVSVGGTRLSVREDGSYLEEAGWEDILSGIGGGGGINPVDPRPSYQQAPGIDTSNENRVVPDVAGPADPDSGFFVTTANPKNGKTVETIVGGTSAASPFWAGAMLLIEQYAQQQGVDRLGFVAPLLYRIAAADDEENPAFHDVTLGGNRLHDAGPGWDYATGLGSPDVFNLAQAMVAELQGGTGG